MKLFACVFLVAGWGQVDTSTVEQSARRLEERLIAPCCWRQPLSIHDSEPARAMKTEIRRELASGKTEAEILAAYEARYGLQILAEPPPVGFHRALYVIPVIAFLAGLSLLSAVLFRWRRKGSPPRDEPPPPPSPERLEQIERELAAQ